MNKAIPIGKKEGTYYLTISPAEDNPLTVALKKIYNSRPLGVVPPKVVTLVPITIVYRSISKTCVEESRIQRLIELKITTLINTAIDRMLEGGIKKAEVWADVISDVVLRTHSDFNTFLKIEYGEISRGIIEMITSELIRESFTWQTKYGYSLDITRAEMDIMLLGSCPGNIVSGKFKQRLYDEDIKVSARKWDLGLSFRKEYLWKKSWWDVIKRIVVSEEEI